MADLDFRLSVGYTDCPKIRRLIRRHGHEALEAHLRLLAFTRTDRPTGVLSGLDADDLGDVMRWPPGDARDLIAAMLEFGLLEEHEDGTLVVHDWAEWNLWAVTAPKRQQIARENAEKRWTKQRAKSKAPQG